MWKKDNQPTPAPENSPFPPEPKQPTISAGKIDKTEKEKQRSPGYTALDRGATAIRKEALSVEPTIISAQCTVSGEISGQSDIRIFGNFQGSVEAPKNVVTVELSGYAKATINANSVTIHGKLIGNVTGLDIVHLVSTGYVEGDIRAANVILDKGATFNGSVEMIREKKGNAPEPAVKTAKYATQVAKPTPKQPASEQKPTAA